MGEEDDDLSCCELMLIFAVAIESQVTSIELCHAPACLALAIGSQVTSIELCHAPSVSLVPCASHAVYVKRARCALSSQQSEGCKVRDALRASKKKWLSKGDPSFLRNRVLRNMYVPPHLGSV